MVNSMISTPIAINCYVVILRLYWFEKRLQNVVSEARLKRTTLTKSRSKARRPSDVERGVNGRNITVMHNGKKSRITNDGILLDGPDDHAYADKEPEATAADARDCHQENPDARGDAVDHEERSRRESRRPPEIKFAGTVKRSDGLEDDAVKLPPTRTDEEHIAILERQRNDSEILQIPNPREAELGILPRRVSHSDSDEPDPLSPINLDGHPAPQSPEAPRRQAITIEEPDLSRAHQSAAEERAEHARAAVNTLEDLGVKNPLHWGRSFVHRHTENTQAEPSGPPRRRTSFNAIRGVLSVDKNTPTPYLSWEPTIGRNSAFPDLTEEQREELGGIEYRSLKLLIKILGFYYWGFWLFGIACLLPWILYNDTYGQIVDQVQQQRSWWGVFTPNSAFADLGFTLTNDSMISFNTATFPLLIMSFLIIIGNTGFPIMLRFVIWVFSLVARKKTELYEELRFLLDHPRRCFTLLFPSTATWWLFLVLFILNGLDVMFFIVLDLGSGPVVNLPTGIKILNGFFEAASTRTAGFSCVNLALLHPAVQVSYMIMMYISVFPIAISVRRTNVYEEKSLGIYLADEDIDEETHKKMSYVGAHLRRQLSFDLWYIFIAFFALSISEGSRIMKNDFSMFAMLFEIVSAYGTVGLSLGYPTVNASLSSQFSTFGKLVMIALMWRGRSRGLPVSLCRSRPYARIKSGYANMCIPSMLSIAPSCCPATIPIRRTRPRSPSCPRSCQAQARGARAQPTWPCHCCTRVLLSGPI